MTIFEDDIAYYMIKSLIVVIGTLVMMSSCMKIKYTAGKIVPVFLAYLLWVGIYTFLSLKMFGFVVMLRFCIPFVSVPAMLIPYYISNFSPWQSIFNYTMQLSISIVLAVSQTLAVTAARGGKTADFLIRVTSYLLCIFLDFRFLRRIFGKLNHIPDRSWRTMTFVPIGFTLLLFIIGTYPVHFSEAPANIVYIYAVTVIMLIVYVILFHSLISQYNLQLAEYSNSILTAQSRSFLKQMEAINSTEEQIKIIRHNMRYNIIVVSDMISAGNTSGALEYLGSVDRKLGETQKNTYCSDTTANAILSYYIEKAESRGIKTDVHFAMPENISIDKLDFTAAVANALENAVIACEKVKSGQKRLRIRTAETKQYIVEIANDYEGEVSFDEEGLPVSNESGHGIGTRSISAFAKKNNAVLDYDITEEWFKLRIVL